MSATLLIACGSDDTSSNDEGSGGGENATGGESSGGGENATGGESSGGGENASGGESSGGGDSGGDPPILDEMPDIEHHCAESTEDCLWMDGHYGSDVLNKFCDKSQGAILRGSIYWICLDDDAFVNIGLRPVESGEFAEDLQSSEENDQNHSFRLDIDAEFLILESPNFAGARCEGTVTPSEEEHKTTIEGVCFGAWGEQSNGSYESELSTSFRVFY